LAAPSACDNVTTADEYRGCTDNSDALLVPLDSLALLLLLLLLLDDGGDSGDSKTTDRTLPIDKSQSRSMRVVVKKAGTCVSRICTGRAATAAAGSGAGGGGGGGIIIMGGGKVVVATGGGSSPGGGNGGGGGGGGNGRSIIGGGGGAKLMVDLWWKIYGTHLSRIRAAKYLRSS
jgi:hypothetical protein